MVILKGLFSFCVKINSKLWDVQLFCFRVFNNVDYYKSQKGDDWMFICKQRDICKQRRSWSDATEHGVWSGSTPFALNTGLSINMVIIITYKTPL